MGRCFGLDLRFSKAHFKATHRVDKGGFYEHTTLLSTFMVSQIRHPIIWQSTALTAIHVTGDFIAPTRAYWPQTKLADMVDSPHPPVRSTEIETPVYLKERFDCNG